MFVDNAAFVLDKQTIWLFCLLCCAEQYFKILSCFVLWQSLLLLFVGTLESFNIIAVDLFIPFKFFLAISLIYEHGVALVVIHLLDQEWGIFCYPNLLLKHSPGWHQMQRGCYRWFPVWGRVSRSKSRVVSPVVIIDSDGYNFSKAR